MSLTIKSSLEILPNCLQSKRFALANTEQDSENYKLAAHVVLFAKTHETLTFGSDEKAVALKAYTLVTICILFRATIYVNFNLTDDGSK
jgi:hypothetical protein